MTEMLSVILSDEELEAKFHDLLDSGQFDTKSDVQRNAIKSLHKDVFGEQDELEDDSQQESEDNEVRDAREIYDPAESRTAPLTTDEIDQILWEMEYPAINPDHLQTLPRPRQKRARIVAAVARWRDVDEDDVEDVIVDVVGRGARDRKLENYRPLVKDEFEGKTPDNVVVDCQRALPASTTVENWAKNVETIIELNADDEIPRRTLEMHLENGRTTLQEAHENAEKRPVVKSVVKKLEEKLCED